MDRNSPQFYIEETEFGCDEVEDFARHVLSLSPLGRQFLKAVDNCDEGSAGIESIGNEGIDCSCLRETVYNRVITISSL